MEEMAASAQGLADMGISLREMVSKFKVGDMEKAEAKVRKPDEKESRIAKLRQQTEGMRKRMREMKKNTPAKQKQQKRPMDAQA